MQCYLMILIFFHKHSVICFNICIFEDNELDKKSVTEKCSLTADDEKNITQLFIV